MLLCPHCGEPIDQKPIDQLRLYLERHRKVALTNLESLKQKPHLERPNERIKRAEAKAARWQQWCDALDHLIGLAASGGSDDV